MADIQVDLTRFMPTFFQMTQYLTIFTERKWIGGFTISMEQNIPVIEIHRKTAASILQRLQGVAK
jgi:hypothetical protein